MALPLPKKNSKALFTKERRNIWLLILTALLVVASVFFFTPPDEKINQGLDIQGGLSVVLTAKDSGGGDVSDEDMEKSRAIIENRVNALGASEATVQLQGLDQILVQIPGLSDTEEALNTIGKTGQLEFARLDSFTDEKVKSSIESGQYLTEDVYTDQFNNSFPTGETKYLEVQPGTYTPLVTGQNITRVTIGQDKKLSANYAVNVKLDSEGTQAFAEATRDLVSTNGQIVIILDGEVQSAPSVDSEIPGGEVSITGGYTLEGAQALQTVLESGSLPVSFEYAQSQVVGPTLGQGALQAGVIVAGIGLLIVMLYLLLFYKGMGLIAAAAMCLFAVLYLGILAFLSSMGLFSLSLAGIAGIVLTIGMAADSSILTLERFREEIKMGRSVKAASMTGVRHAIITSIDADLVTMISALSLFFLASASVKGFGLTLALGIMCDILMMLIFKAPLIRALAPKVIKNNPAFWGIKQSLEIGEQDSFNETNILKKGDVVEEEHLQETVVQAAEESELSEGADAEAHAQVTPPAPARQYNRFLKWDINILGRRKIFLTIAAVAVIACFAVVGLRGLNFGIEFVGGTSVTFHETGEITTDQMREAFNEAGESDAVIQTVSTDGSDGFLIRTTTVSAEEATASANQVAAKLGLSTQDFEVTTIGPDWGASVIQSSLIAFLVSILLIIIYIAIRFEYKMGISAIVALLHDLIIVMGIYALFGREINPNTIAALLTILGYSLYDSVVVFHRINDNMKLPDIKCTFMTMANHSINQVLVRTMNTSLTSLAPVVAMLLFGGQTLSDFAFAMVIGLVVGAYSSIAIASPLYGIWKTREQKYAKLVKKYGAQVDLFQFGSSAYLDSRSKTAKSKAAPVTVAAGVSTGEGAASAGTSKKSTPKNAKQPQQQQGGKKQQSNHRYKKKKKK